LDTTGILVVVVVGGLVGVAMEDCAEAISFDVLDNADKLTFGSEEIIGLLNILERPFSM